jgi:HD-GYP domain-containing protein (c-di-GMP phosphodiesterase class II)
LTKLAPESEFEAIRVATLRGDQKIPFNVYLKVAGKFIHYCRRGDSFEGTRLERLKTKRVRKMYIRPEDEIAYQHYLDANISAAYDSSRPLDVRAEVIQGFQQAAAEEYMEEPKDELGYKHVRTSVQRFVQFLEEEDKGAGALLRLPNTDRSITHHSVNVATLSVAIAANPEFQNPALHLLGMGCLLHDIEHFYSEGFDLSRPPASLQGEEKKIYEGHPLGGAHRFQGVLFVDQLVLNIIAQHEEHADGSGFPKKLRADEMDPLILVAATANAYDRLVSFEGKSPKDALKYLLIDKMGVYPLNYLQALQGVLKEQGLV